ncbi:hypothetical protein BB560_000995 [Smittium megazygosporum]|uniref:RRM domain-containing protein n=1 Tax=Smittium megazygosporum TaxID=133381 RepID=A0A2T9ZIQ6_9FUNG|nr:hypothetical protein BB560_000995 [Smittium megazygosporum]
MSTRIIVKNLPKNYSEQRFKAHFEEKGVVTDSKIMYTVGGTSRRFGFIGYKTEKEAKAAVRYFNGTFIDTSKIVVELAKPIGSYEISKSWSAYTKAKNAQEHHRMLVLRQLESQSNREGSTEIELQSSSASSISEKQGPNTLDNGQKSDKLRQNTGNLSVLQTLYEETVAKNATDPRFAEFLQVMAPRAKSKTWANDDINMFSHSERKVLSRLISEKKKQAGVIDKNLAAEKKKVKASVQPVLNKKPGGQNQVLSKTHITFDESDQEEDNANQSSKDETPDEFDVNYGVNSTNENIKSSEFALSSSLSDDIEWLKKHIKGPEDPSTQELESQNSEQKKMQEDSKSDKSKPTAKLAPDNTIQQAIVKDFQAKQKEREEAIEKISDTGRLFVRNLPYGTSEDQLRKYFERYGPLSELHVPIDKETKKPKGFAYVLYVLPEHAVKAFKSSDHQFFQGRLLHIIPADEKPGTKLGEAGKDSLGGDGGEQGSLKKKREEKRKANAGSSFNWNSLYMSTDAIADSISERLKINKADLLLNSDIGLGTNPNNDSKNKAEISPAVRLALAETHIISETKRFFEDNGIILDAFSGKSKGKSSTVILVKNIPFSETKFRTDSSFQEENDGNKVGNIEEEIVDMFGKFGNLGRVLVPSARTIAIVEFLEPQEARAAFRQLAYKRFGGVPLYLEWAPEKMFKDKYDPSVVPSKASSVKNRDELSEDLTEHSNNNNQASASVNNENNKDLNTPKSQSRKQKQKKVEENDNDDEDDENEIAGKAGKVLFIKNLSFETTQETLESVFGETEGLCSVLMKTRLRKKPSGEAEKLSLGYGFAEYKTENFARKAIQALQGVVVDGHSLQLKTSDKVSIASESGRKVSDNINKVSSDVDMKKKLVVRNVPFEATRSDIRDLFSTYAQVKSVRLPNKFSGGHRGFAFVEFLTHQEATNCLELVGAGTHLYGRRLVVAWAEDDDEVEEDGKGNPKSRGGDAGHGNEYEDGEKPTGLEKLRIKAARKFNELRNQSSTVSVSNKKLKS